MHDREMLLLQHLIDHASSVAELPIFAAAHEAATTLTSHLKCLFKVGSGQWLTKVTSNTPKEGVVVSCFSDLVSKNLWRSQPLEMAIVNARLLKLLSKCFLREPTLATDGNLPHVQK